METSDSNNTTVSNNKFTALDDRDISILEQIAATDKKIHFLFKQFFFVLIIDILIGGAVCLWFFAYIKERAFIHVVIFIIVIMLLIIFTLFSSVLALIRLIIIRKSLITKIQTKFTHNYVVANFWTAAKFMISEICLIKNSREIFYNGGLYIINPACAWLDKKKRPNLFYFEGVPNPIDLHFETNLAKFKAASTEERQNIKDSYGESLDIAYDSMSLKLFKDDTSLKNIMKEKGENSNIMVIILIIFGVIVVIILIYIAIKLGAKPQVVTPVTTAPGGA